MSLRKRKIEGAADPVIGPDEVREDGMNRGSQSRRYGLQYVPMVFSDLSDSAKGLL